MLKYILSFSGFFFAMKFAVSQSRNWEEQKLWNHIKHLLGNVEQLNFITGHFEVLRAKSYRQNTKHVNCKYFQMSLLDCSFVYDEDQNKEYSFNFNGSLVCQASSFWIFQIIDLFMLLLYKVLYELWSKNIQLSQCKWYTFYDSWLTSMVVWPEFKGSHEKQIIA